MDELAGQYEPAGQLIALPDPAGQYLPAGHAWHAAIVVAAVVVLNVPAGQAVQVVLLDAFDVLLYVPAAHATGEFEPAGQ